MSTNAPGGGNGGGGGSDQQPKSKLAAGIVCLFLVVVVGLALGLGIGLSNANASSGDAATEPADSVEALDATTTAATALTTATASTTATTSVTSTVASEGATTTVASDSTDASATSADATSTTIASPVPSIEAAAWPHDSSDIPPDPTVTYNALPNGFRYILLPHANPPTKLSLRLHIKAGSLMENEDQRGLAHFLEHMLFNGLRNFENSQELIYSMQRLGIAFGTHVNAYTSFDETVYMLDLPNMDEDVLDLCFKVMRDYMDGALLKEEEIDAERGVVLAEKTARDSVDMRIMEEQFEFLFPDHLLTQRFPIGTEEVIRNAPRERFVEFYEKYYIPVLGSFIVVGDFGGEGDAGVKLMQERVIRTFENMTNPAGYSEEEYVVDTGEVPVDTGLRAAVFTDEELSTSLLNNMVFREYHMKTDTEQNRIDEFGLAIAHSIIGSRFGVLVDIEGSPILGGGAYRSNWYNEIEFGGVYVFPVQGQEEFAIFVLEQEFRRAVEFGFTQSEINLVKAATLNAYEEAVERKATRDSDGLANAFVTTINGNTVFSSPEENLRIAEKAFEMMTPELVHEYFLAFWDTKDITLMLEAKEAPENATDTLLSVYAESQTYEVFPPIDYGNETFSYTDFGPPGEVVSDTNVEHLEIRQIVLSNNVRVNMKRTTYEENSIILKARFGSGLLGMPKDATWLDVFTESVMAYGGLGNHSSDELARIFAGRNVGMAFSVNEGDFSFAGSTTPEDLELQLQLLAAFFSDPGYREESVRSFRNVVPIVMSDLRYSMEGAYAHMNEWLYGGDGRFAVPTEEVLLSYEAVNAREWLHPQLTGSYLEFSIVGDLPDDALDSILKTLGALPERDGTFDRPNIAPEIDFPTEPKSQVFTFESKVQTAYTTLIWEIPPLGSENINETRALWQLSEIYDDRAFFLIREEYALAYSPSVGGSPSEAFDFGRFTASSIVSPDNATFVADLLLGIAADLFESGTNEDELLRSIEPKIASLDDTLRDNNYWLSVVMGECQEKPYHLDWSRNRGAFYDSITVETMNEVAKKYLDPEKVLRVELLPVELSGGEPLRMTDLIGKKSLDIDVEKPVSVQLPPVDLGEKENEIKRRLREALAEKEREHQRALSIAPQSRVNLNEAESRMRRVVGKYLQLEKPMQSEKISQNSSNEKGEVRNLRGGN